jgi:predicted aldo/keto reductase-like oxidoreductase
VFVTSKCAARDAAGAERDLATTLATLNVDALDLWQIHDVRSDDELRALTRRGGALEVFLSAKERGRVRHIGVTGHHDPRVLAKAVRELPVDTVLLPINVAEVALGGFTDAVVAEARARGIGVVGMKVLGQRALIEAGFDAADLVRFALAEDCDLVIVGCSSPAEVLRNVDAASAPPMDDAERRALVDRARPSARKLAYYRAR